MLNLKKLLSHIIIEISNLLSLKDYTDQGLNRIQYSGVQYGGSLSTTVSVPTATYKTLRSVTVPPGTYFIQGWVGFLGSTTGRRYVYIVTQQDKGGIPYIGEKPTSGGMRMFISDIFVVTEETTYYLNVWQNSGSTQDITTGGLIATRLI